VAWTFDNIRLFVQKLNDTDVQTIARLNPIGGGTTLHFFGWEDTITKVGCMIVGLDDRDAIRSRTRDESFYTFSGPWGEWGDYAIKQAVFELANVTCQTLRPDLDENSPVFNLDLELYHDYP